MPATFELEDLTAEDGRLVVTGHWSGVRGLRFVRPTLVTDGRDVLATLEHKPWAPVEGEPWTAAFPWDGTAGTASAATLAVTPNVAVSLSGDDVPTATRTPGRPPARSPQRPSDPDRGAPAEVVEGRSPQRDEIDARIAELRAIDERRRAEARSAIRAAQDERDAAVREQQSLGAALRRAEAERDDVRERGRRVLEEARSQRHAASQATEALAAAQAERDGFGAQLEDARRHLDETLTAHRALERRLIGAAAVTGPRTPRIPHRTPPTVSIPTWPSGCGRSRPERRWRRTCTAPSTPRAGRWASSTSGRSASSARSPRSASSPSW